MVSRESDRVSRSHKTSRRATSRSLSPSLWHSRIRCCGVDRPYEVSQKKHSCEYVLVLASPPLTKYQWAEKRVMYMTPQTLVKDFQSCIVDPKDIVLIVFGMYLHLES